MSQAKQSEAPAPALLVEVRRGRIVESRHRGHVVACEPDGGEVARLGAPEMVTYLRSSAKPFQSMPLVAAGAAGRVGFTPPEGALPGGPPSGGPVHQAAGAGGVRQNWPAAAAFEGGRN